MRGFSAAGSSVVAARPTASSDSASASAGRWRCTWAAPASTRFGWRATFLVYGLLEGLLALPLLYALFRERPGDLPQARRTPADALPGATPGQAWRSADFWLIVGNLILGVFAVTGVMVHGVPLLQERGLSREVATDVLAAL